MANKKGHRRFGNVRKLASGRFQARPGFFTGVTGLSPELQACHFDHGFRFVGRVGSDYRVVAPDSTLRQVSFHDRRGGVVVVRSARSVS